MWRMWWVWWLWWLWWWVWWLIMAVTKRLAILHVFLVLLGAERGIANRRTKLWLLSPHLYTSTTT